MDETTHLIGMLLGILLGNTLGFFMSASFVMPWAWMLLAIFICFIVGVGSGIYPAIKASRLDPIEALRYE